MNYYYEKAIELGADGVDFVPLLAVSAIPYLASVPNVIASYTTEELKSVAAVPKTPCLFYKIVKGKKKYIRSNKLNEV